MVPHGDLDELHAMAAKIGLKLDWFQDHKRVPHYDLRPSKRKLAVLVGAAELGAIEIVRRCRKNSG